MIAIRATYDGKEFKPLPSESLPDVKTEVPVAIVFLETPINQDEKRQRQFEAAQRMLAARDAMRPFDVSVKDLIEEGRER